MPVDTLPFATHKKMIHREHAWADGPVVAYYRAGVSWEVYWVPEGQPGSELTGGFASLVDARHDAEVRLARPAT